MRWNYSRDHFLPSQLTQQRGEFLAKRHTAHAIHDPLPAPWSKTKRKRPCRLRRKNERPQGVFQIYVHAKNGSCYGHAHSRWAMSSQLHKDKRAGRGILSLKSTKWKMTDTFSDVFGITKGQRVAGRLGPHYPFDNTTVLKEVQHGFHQRVRFAPLKNRWRWGDLRSKLGGQLLDIHPHPHNLVPRLIKTVVGPNVP